MKRAKTITGTLSAVILCMFFLTSCTSSGEKIDPGVFGYDCEVVYDALGGVINSRGVRTTYYMENSCVFEPSGTSNMLVEPEREGVSAFRLV